jgi:sigma-B regulation protein RsbU (phosphoserine phosphatase)
MNEPERKFSLALSVLLMGWWLAPHYAASQESLTLELSEEEQTWLADHPVVRIGPVPDYPPVEFLDFNGQHTGIVAEYVLALEEMLGIDFALRRYDTWSEVLEASQQREVDILMELADTPERREFLTFTRPYLALPAVIIVREDQLGTVSLADLVGERVAIPEGYVTLDYAREAQPDLEIIPVPSVEEGLERVSFGSADALIASIAVASYHIQQLGLTNLRVGGNSGFVFELAIGVRSDWPIMANILQKALDSVSENERQRIYNNWVTTEADEPAVSALNLALGLAILILTGLLIGRIYSERREKISPELTRSGIQSSWPTFVVATAAAGVVIVGAIWNGSVLEERARRDVENAVLTVLNTASQGAFQWLREREEEIALWVNLPQIRDASIRLAGTASGSEDVEQAREGFRLAVEPLIVGKSYRGYALATIDGASLVDGPDGADFDLKLALPPGVISAVRDEPTHRMVAMPEIAGASRSEMIVFGQGVVDADNQVRAILIMYADSSTEFSNILQRGRIGESGETYAFNHSGQLVSESRFDADLLRIGLLEPDEKSVLRIEVRNPGGNLLTGYEPDQLRSEQPLTLMAETAVSGRSGTMLDPYSDYRGVPVVGAWVWDGAYQLGIATEMDADEAYEFLRVYQRQAVNQKLENAYATIKVQSDRMVDELNVGREIQMSMIPLNFPAFPNYKEFVVFAKLQPALEVGGDFYDFFFIDEDHFCICIGDVSGKGVPSALFMAVTKTLIKSRATEDLSTGSIITHVNDELSVDNKSCMFVTLFLAIVNIHTGELLSTNAGHNPPYVKRKDGPLERLDQKHGPVVGALSGMVYSEQKQMLLPGDLIVLYTDGVTEAANTKEEMYCEDRLERLLGDGSIESAEKAVLETVSSVCAFEQGSAQSDDITVLAFEYKGSRSESSMAHHVVTLPNDISELQSAMDTLEAAMSQSSIPELVINRSKVILDEILSNIILYAYDDEQEHTIEIRLSLDSNGIRVTIKDDGIPFNPLGRAAPDTTAPMEERELGGLGIHLVKKLADEVVYQRHINSNVLTIVLSSKTAPKTKDALRAGEIG